MTDYVAVPGASVVKEATLADDATAIKVGDVNPLFEVLLDNDATLDDLKANLAGATFTGNIVIPTGVQITVQSGGKIVGEVGSDIEVGGDLTVKSTGAVTVEGLGTVTLESTAELIGEAGSSVALSGKTAILGRYRRGLRIALTDSNHTISPATGFCFELSATPAAVRTIKLQTTTAPVPDANEMLEIIVPGAMAVGKNYIIAREDNTPICEFWGNAAGDAGASAQFEFNAGVWRLGLNCAGGAAGGVLPKAGA